MDKAALGFSNTIDYEIQWDRAHLETLIRRTGLRECEIRDQRNIGNMKGLLSSILFHMREGSGCGLLTETSEVIEAFLKGTTYRVALGGTNLRAAEVISALGGSALVHLVSVNEDTVKRMPENISWVGGQNFKCCFPHIALQFPKNACVKANDIEITAPRENRVIYSGDAACAQMPLNKEFFVKAAGARAVLLSGFDLIVKQEILSARLLEVKTELSTFHKNKPFVFYEHACFADDKLEDLVRSELGAFLDIYSMNEDEFQTLTGEKIDLLNDKEVLEGLGIALKKLPDMTVIVHTCYWTIAVGQRAEEIAGALEYGMLTATTRYWRGTVDRERIETTRKLPVQAAAEIFCQRIEAASDFSVKCLPAPEIKSSHPTTVGLGDSFVGGFLYQYCFG